MARQKFTGPNRRLSRNGHPCLFRLIRLIGIRRSRAFRFPRRLRRSRSFRLLRRSRSFGLLRLIGIRCSPSFRLLRRSRSFGLLRLIGIRCTPSFGLFRLLRLICIMSTPSWRPVRFPARPARPARPAPCLLSRFLFLCHGCDDALCFLCSIQKYSAVLLSNAV